MASVHFAPQCAIKYTGKKAKEFTHSLARPRPVLKRGDIIVVSKQTAFNLVKKGFGEFEEVKAINFSKADAKLADSLAELERELEQANETIAMQQEEIDSLTLLKDEPVEETEPENTEPVEDTEPENTEPVEDTEKQEKE